MNTCSRLCIGAVVISNFVLLLLFTRAQLSIYSPTEIVQAWPPLPSLFRSNTPPKEDSSSEGEPLQVSPTPLIFCGEDYSFLNRYNLTPDIHFAARDIVAVHNSSAKRPSITRIKETLFESLTTLQLNGPNIDSDTTCLPSLMLQVSHPPSYNLSDLNSFPLIFGIQTTLSRLRDTKEHISRWLRPTKAHLHVIVQKSEGIPANTLEMKQVEAEYMTEHVKVTLHNPLEKNHSFPQRYFSLIKLLWNNRTPEMKWIVLMDDDTFFPNMPKLREVLGEYDHTKPHYIGALSEDSGAVNLYGRMAFGGAGIFLSIAMAEILMQNYDQCITHLRSSAGDVTVFDCVRRFTTVDLTYIQSLHQMDVYVDQGGVYESGKELLSVHHWKGEQNLSIDKMHLVSDLCGDCFLQRWEFPGELLLANGYSISHYPFGHLSGALPGPERVLDDLGRGNLEKREVGKVEKIDLGKVESTWKDWELFNVEHSLGPTRPKMKEGSKISFRLEDSFAVDTGVLTQVYVKRGREGLEDAVVVLNWIPSRRKEALND